MNFPLEGPKLKIERAYQKLAELKAVEEQFFKINKPRLDIDVDSETGERSAVIRLDENLPGVMRILPGEIIYHLRSALDLTAVALGRMSAKNQTSRKSIFQPVTATRALERVAVNVLKASIPT